MEEGVQNNVEDDGKNRQEHKPGVPTPSSGSYVMRPAATFVNYV